MSNKNNDLYKNFIDDNILVNPTLNDSLNLKKFRHLSGVMENHFSVAHEERELQLYKKYLNKISKSESNLNISDKFLKFICETNIESHLYNFNLIPVNPLNDLTYLTEDALKLVHMSLQIKRVALIFFQELKSYLKCVVL